MHSSSETRPAARPAPRSVQIWRVGAAALRGSAVFAEHRLARKLGLAPRTMPLLYLEVTRDCNLGCLMCGYPSTYPDRGELLTTDEIHALLDDAVAHLGTRVVSFGGGEPFLRGDLLDLLDHARRRGLALHVNTNGTLVDERCARALARHVALTLFVSLDHPDASANDAIRGPGVFRRCEATLARLRRIAPRVRVGLNVVVGAHNIGQLERMVALARQWDVHGIKFVPLHANLAHRWDQRPLPAALRLDDTHLDRLGLELLAASAMARRCGLATSSRAYLRGIPEFLRGRPSSRCFAGYVYGNVDPYGQLFPCYDHMEANDVRAPGLPAAWRSRAMQRMRARVCRCAATCWNSGNAEPSLRLDLRHLVADPAQLAADLELLGP